MDEREAAIPRDEREAALAELEFLAASPNRLRLLDALAGESVTPDALGDRLDLPRSTLQRNLSALEERGYVTYNAAENEYEETTAGGLARSALAGALSTVSTATTLAPFLEQFPVDLPVEPDALADCEVTLATANDPYEPVSAVKQAIGAAGEVRAFMPTVNPLYIESIRKYDIDEVDLEAIVPPAAYDALAENYGALLDRLSSSPTTDFYETTTVPDYVLAFAGDTLLLGALDEHMRTHSVLQAPPDSPVFSWAEQTYDSVKETAARFEGRDG